MITILLSHERSGSHLMGELLDSFEGVKMYDEVCNAQAVPPREREESFHRFRYNWTRSHSEFALDPSFLRQTDFVNAYFLHVASISSDPNVVIDIKYGHLHNFDWYWCPPFWRPHLCFICETLPVRVIHLYRQNVLEASVSNYVSGQRQLWHSWQPGFTEERESSYTVEVDEIIEEALRLGKLTHWMKEQLDGRIDWIEMHYEELVKALAADDQVFFERLAGFVGGEPSTKFEPKIRKIGRPLPRMIKNYDELVVACRMNGLEQYL